MMIMFYLLIATVSMQLTLPAVFLSTGIVQLLHARRSRLHTRWRCEPVAGTAGALQPGPTDTFSPRSWRARPWLPAGPLVVAVQRRGSMMGPRRRRSSATVRAPESLPSRGKSRGLGSGADFQRVQDKGGRQDGRTPTAQLENRCRRGSSRRTPPRTVSACTDTCT